MRMTAKPYNKRPNLGRSLGRSIAFGLLVVAVPSVGQTAEAGRADVTTMVLSSIVAKAKETASLNTTTCSLTFLITDSQAPRSAAKLHEEAARLAEVSGAPGPEAVTTAVQSMERLRQHSYRVLTIGIAERLRTWEFSGPVDTEPEASAPLDWSIARFSDQGATRPLILDVTWPRRTGEFRLSAMNLPEPIEFGRPSLYLGMRAASLLEKGTTTGQTIKCTRAGDELHLLIEEKYSFRQPSGEDSHSVTTTEARFSADENMDLLFESLSVDGQSILRRRFQDFQTLPDCRWGRFPAFAEELAAMSTDLTRPRIRIYRLAQNIRLDRTTLFERLLARHGDPVALVSELVKADGLALTVAQGVELPAPLLQALRP